MRIVAASVFLIALGLVAAHAAPAKGKARAKASAAARSSIVLKPGIKLSEVVEKLGKHVTIRGADAELAKQYTLPPYLAGKTLARGGASTALTFLFGTGWEGSRLPEAQRAKGKNFEIARTPYAYLFGGAAYYVCNNRMWDWTAEANKVVVARRVKDDGDLVETKRGNFGKIKNDLTLGTLLDELNRQTGVNVTNLIGKYHVAEKTQMLAKGRATEIEMPMTASSIPAPLQKRLAEGVSVGEFLSIMCIGLDRHTQQLGGDWKWSSAYEGNKLVYTLRDYAHVQ